MLLPESDITAWKEEMRGRDASRKTAQQEAMKTQFSKPVTWRDVKQKDLEYHPILQKFARDEKENTEKVKEAHSWQRRADSQKKYTEQYLVDYNIINLEKDASLGKKTEIEKTYSRLMPSAQVDYNIITNNKLDDFYFQNARLNVDVKKKLEKKTNTNGIRDYNIISNKYVTDHDTKAEFDGNRVRNELSDKYNKTHNYNLLLGEFYDKNKEELYQEQRLKDQQDHGKSKLERLPPTIKNRETIIFDPTREVPEAIKILDQKKKDAMKKYEVRYQVENQLRERDFDTQDKVEQMKLARINDKKFTEHLDKGFDILTLNEYDKNNLQYTAKPVPSKWEKLRLTSNAPMQAQARTIERPALTTQEFRQDLRQATQGLVSPAARAQTNYNVDTSGKVSNLLGWSQGRSASMVNSEVVGVTRTEDNFGKTKSFQSAQQRSQEPVYNLADKYNQYCVPPKRVVDDFNTRTLPQIKVADNSLKFGLTKTGGFKRLDINDLKTN